VRRTAIAAALFWGISAAFAAGCGGDSDGSATSDPAGDENGQGSSAADSLPDSTDAPDTTGNGEPPEIIRTCEKNVTLVVNEFGVVNNMHGEYRLVPGDSYVQCMEIKNGSFPITWTWDVRTDQPFVKGFPQIFFGINPWTRIPTTDRLPARVGDLAALEVRHVVGLRADGLYNLAFDMWLTVDETPTQHERTHEVMVWLAGNIPMGEGKLGETKVGEETWEFYRKEMEGAPPLLIFVPRVPRTTGTTDLLFFLRKLIEDGHITEDVYVSIIELGTEMWHGSGVAAVGDFSVSIELK